MTVNVNRTVTPAVRDNNAFPAAVYAAKKPDETLAELHSDMLGLDEIDALDRLIEHQENVVAHDKAPPAFIQFISAFHNPFIYVLLALAVISFMTDYLIPLQQGEDTDLTGVLIIGTMVFLSVVLRFWQEYRTNKAAEALKSLVKTTATVLRRKKGRSVRAELPVKCLVPGDIVVLSAGDMIPADLRLLRSRDLFISQAILTGESVPVEKYDTQGDIHEKDAATITENGQSLTESGNICLMGTNVASGTALGVVVATGDKTYFGSLAKSIVGTRSQTSFDRGVNSVSILLIRFMLVMVPVVLLINGFTKGDWFDATLFALAVAVGLTPEMLPMIVSSNLAKGAIAMSRRKVIVKRLNAIQNFGAMDILCTDKTGTLTQDNIILEHHLDTEGNTDEAILGLAWLNSFHQSGTRNLMDQAIIRFGRGKAETESLHNYQKIDELPFDFVRRRLSVSVRKPDGTALLICKGAAEEMLACCSLIRTGNHISPADDEKKQAIMALVNHYNETGFRVLLLAERVLDSKEQGLPLSADSEQNMILCGILTFLDPPKDSAAKALKALKHNGVTVKVLTGDNAVVTAKICREVGLDASMSISGDQLALLGDEELKQVAQTHTIFCKLTPLQKSALVRILQSAGHTVGFLGDGINDAPALRDADVGISVDSGTDIAKESADIILLEKGLMVLEEGVIKGRETFGNIIKYLNMTASSNFGNVFSVLIASAFIPFLPMLAIQLLIQNLLYDMSQLALPWDKMDKEFLRKPRKWDAGNIRRFMIWIGPTSSVFDITTFALLWFVFGANSPDCQVLFHSGWFVEGLLSQTLVVHMLRTQRIPFIQSTATLPVLLVTGIVMAIGIWLPFSPIGSYIGLEPLPWEYFPWLAATLVSYCGLAQIMKGIYIRRFGMWL